MCCACYRDICKYFIQRGQCSLSLLFVLRFLWVHKTRKRYWEETIWKKKTDSIQLKNQINFGTFKIKYIYTSKITKGKERKKDRKKERRRKERKRERKKERKRRKNWKQKKKTAPKWKWAWGIVTHDTHVIRERRGPERGIEGNSQLGKKMPSRAKDTLTNRQFVCFSIGCFFTTTLHRVLWHRQHDDHGYRHHHHCSTALKSSRPPGHRELGSLGPHNRPSLAGTVDHSGIPTCQACHTQ